MIKRDGELQRFDRTKLRAALLAAAHKRPVTAVDVETIVDRIMKRRYLRMLNRVLNYRYLTLGGCWPC